MSLLRLAITIAIILWVAGGEGVVCAWAWGVSVLPVCKPILITAETRGAANVVDLD